VREIQVHRVDGLAPELRVEHEAAGREAAARDQLQHRRRQFLRIVRELVRVPAIARIAAVDVDGTEDPVGRRCRELVLEVDPRQRGMIHFDVDGHFLVETIPLQERTAHRAATGSRTRHGFSRWPCPA